MAEIIAEVQANPTEIVTITPRAAEEIRKIKVENKIPESHALRLGVKGGGCSGMSYVLAFDENPKSQFYLSGTTLDFSDGLSGRGFVFNNPNAARTCGCGHSFGV